MSDTLEDMGPIDYLLVEWPDRQPDGSAMPHLINLVEAGIVRIIDLAFITKGEDGIVATASINELGAEFQVFDGASSGLLGDDDIEEAGSAMEPGTSAALLVWENRWAAPFASALRKNGAQVVATGRIPIQQLVAALDAVEAAV